MAVGRCSISRVAGVVAVASFSVQCIDSLDQQVLSLSRSEVSVTDSVVASGSTTTVVLRTRDVSGEPMIVPSLPLVFALAEGSSTATFGPATDRGDGTYAATLTGVMAGPSAPLVVTVSGKPVTSAMPRVAVVPGPVSAAGSRIVAERARLAVGDSIWIRVEAVDAAGNRLRRGGSVVEFQLTGGTASALIGPVRDVGDGTYEARLTGQRSGMPFIVRATIDGEPVTGAVPTVEVGFGNASPLSIFDMTNVTVRMGESVRVDLLARDPGGAPISRGGATVVFGHEGGTSTGVFSPTTDHGNGRYTAIFTGVSPGTPTRLTATANGYAVTTTQPQITVRFPYLGRQEMTITPTEMQVGDTATLRVGLWDHLNKPITFPNAVTFSVEAGTTTGTLGPVVLGGDGTYSARFIPTGPGQVELAATYGSGSELYQIRSPILTVRQPATSASTVSVTPKGTFLQGLPTTLTAEFRDSNGRSVAGKTFSWTSLNPNVARVEGNGTVYPVGAGQAIIRATAEGISGYAVVTVDHAPARPVQGWTPVAPSHFWHTVRGGWVWSESEVWAAAGANVLRYIGGSTWWYDCCSHLPNESWIRGVWGTSSEQVYAFGTSGRLARRSPAGSWEMLFANSGTVTESMWGSAPNDIYLCTDTGLSHFDGFFHESRVYWSTIGCLGIWGTAVNDVFMVGAWRATSETVVGVIEHFDGSVWSRMPLPATGALTDVWGTSATNVYAVGGSKILHYDGNNWVLVPVPVANGQWERVWGTSQDDVFVVGWNQEGGILLRFDGAAWTVALRTPERLYSVFGTPQGTVFVGGSNGTMLRGDR